MYLRLIRQPAEGELLRGELRIDGRYFCSTIERSSVAIPTLIYSVSVSQSAKFGRLLPIIQSVPGRSGIRIHRGSKPSHSGGCILVSPAEEQLLTRLILQARRDGEDVRLEISSFVPEYSDEACSYFLTAPDVVGRL